ncbi:MAG: hypothetical protein ABI284_07025, partial [Nitrosospira sp.]
MRNAPAIGHHHQADTTATRRRIEAIVERSTPMWMRCASTRDQKTGNNISDQLARWQTVIGSDRGLRRRLANCGFTGDPEEYLARCGHVDLPANARWLSVFTRVLSATTSNSLAHEPLSTDPAIDPADPVPFEELLIG